MTLHRHTTLSEQRKSPLACSLVMPHATSPARQAEALLQTTPLDAHTCTLAYLACTAPALEILVHAASLVSVTMGRRGGCVVARPWHEPWQAPAQRFSDPSIPKQYTLKPRRVQTRAAGARLSLVSTPPRCPDATHAIVHAFTRAGSGATSNPYRGQRKPSARGFKLSSVVREV